MMHVSLSFDRERPRSSDSLVMGVLCPNSTAAIFIIVGVVTMSVSAFDFVATVFLHWPPLPDTPPSNSSASQLLHAVRLGLV